MYLKRTPILKPTKNMQKLYEENYLTLLKDLKDKSGEKHVHDRKTVL